MSQVKQIRRKMFDTRDFKKRLELMFLIRALDWKEKQKLPRVMVAIESFDLDWELQG